VYHIRIIAKKIGSHDMKQTDSSIIMVRNVCVLTSASMIVYLFFTRSWSAIIGTKQSKVNQSPQQWRGRYTCTRICRFLVVGNIFRLQTCMNSLVKVPPYSKLNFQGNIFFNINWCNIVLKLLGKCVHSYKSRSKAIVYDFVEQEKFCKAEQDCFKMGPRGIEVQ
jgi:hypothetical protein